MIFGEIMRWREGDGGREGAEIISRKVVRQSDSWRFLKVKLTYSDQKLSPSYSLGHI